MANDLFDYQKCFPNPLINSALSLAEAAANVCDIYAGDKTVDTLRAALSAFDDLYNQFITESGR